MPLCNVEESLEEKVLTIMVALWLDHRLTALIRGKDRISETLGLDAAKARITVLSLLAEASSTLRSRNVEHRLQNISAIAMVGFWIEGELVTLKREVGRISKTMGLHGYQVSDFVLSLLGKASEALSAAYESNPQILSVIPAEEETPELMAVEQSLDSKVLKIMVGRWLVESVIHDKDRTSQMLWHSSFSWTKTLLPLLGEASRAKITGENKRSANADIEQRIAQWLEKRLEDLERDMGRVSKRMGISARQASGLVLSLLPEVSEAIRKAYNFEQERVRRSR